MRPLLTVALIGVSAGLAGCARLHLSDDFGQAVRQNVAAQVDDPDAKYAGIPEGGTDGQRSGSAMDRYVKGEVKQPESTKTSTVKTSGGSSGQ